MPILGFMGQFDSSDKVPMNKNVFSHWYRHFLRLEHIDTLYQSTDDFRPPDSLTFAYFLTSARKESNAEPFVDLGYMGHRGAIQSHAFRIGGGLALATSTDSGEDAKNRKRPHSRRLSKPVAWSFLLASLADVLKNDRCFQ